MAVEGTLYSLTFFSLSVYLPLFHMQTHTDLTPAHRPTHICSTLSPHLTFDHFPYCVIGVLVSSYSGQSVLVPKGLPEIFFKRPTFKLKDKKKDYVGLFYPMPWIRGKSANAVLLSISTRPEVWNFPQKAMVWIPLLIKLSFGLNIKYYQMWHCCMKQPLALPNLFSITVFIIFATGKYIAYWSHHQTLVWTDF